MDSSQTEASSAPRSTYLDFLAGTAVIAGTENNLEYRQLKF
jgi:hypothetical protein